ncbi:YugN family protein [Paenibacillus senegalensis]|uniref:YugN family protein n=1 Tax=Paenibacillus senegalensis TaxID=1465766 RepID=UPI00028A24DF|nr:YugN family protein [Paenibacillus senegalensis]
MIIENTGINGLKTDLAHLDEAASETGFFRSQWEYYRATYDLKLIDEQTRDEYYVRVNTRVELGKLEKPDTILYVESAYIGRATFPHGLDYTAPVPKPILDEATRRLNDFKSKIELALQ